MSVRQRVRSGTDLSKALKKADPRNDMTILKLTYRSSAMLQSLQPTKHGWYWKSKPFIGAISIFIGLLNFVFLYPLNANQVFAIFYGVFFVSNGAFHLVIWWLYSIRGRRELLELEKTMKNQKANN